MCIIVHYYSSLYEIFGVFSHEDYGKKYKEKCSGKEEDPQLYFTSLKSISHGSIGLKVFWNMEWMAASDPITPTKKFLF